MREQSEFDLFDGLKINDDQKPMIDRINTISDIIYKIVKRRTEMNLTQRELADVTHIKQPMIARIENFKTIPRLDTLVTICQALKIKLEPLVEEETNFQKIEITFKVEIKNDSNDSFHILDMDTSQRGIGQVC